MKPGKRDKSLSIRYAAPSIARDPPNFHSILVDRGKTRARDFRLPWTSRGFGTPRLSPVHAIPIRRAAIRSLLPRSHVARNRAISSRHAATRRWLRSACFRDDFARFRAVNAQRRFRRREISTRDLFWDWPWSGDQKLDVSPRRSIPKGIMEESGYCICRETLSRYSAPRFYALRLWEGKDPLRTNDRSNEITRVWGVRVRLHASRFSHISRNSRFSRFFPGIRLARILIT